MGRLCSVKMKMAGVIRLVVFLFAPLFAFGEVIEVDVGEWADVSNGVTSAGWEVGGLDRYSAREGGYTRLNTKDDYVISPDFDNAVTQVVICVKSSSATISRFLTLTPTVSNSVARQWTAVAGEDLGNQTFTWTLSEGVRQFRLQNESGSGGGTWAIAALTVYTDGVEPPTGLREDALYRDAFTAAWDPAPKADHYDVQYASVTRTPPSYKTIAEWDFSSLTNTYKLTRTLDQLQTANPGKLDDLSGTNVCLQASESGHIQIGRGEALGCLVLPVRLPSENARELTGLLRAWKYPSNGKPTMPIYSVGDGRTNDLATVELTNENAEYRFPIPKGVAVESVILSSATNGIALTDQNGRVRVESFAIVSDYVPDSVTTNEFKSVEARTTEKTVTDLVPGEWLWSVRSLDADGHGSSWSPLRTVILDPKGRKYSPPGFRLLLR